MKLVAVVIALLAIACAKPAAGPQIANGRCSCASGALCLQPSGGTNDSISCAPSETAGLGCAAFTNASRRCWGSPSMSGLCVCASNGGQVAAQ